MIKQLIAATVLLLAASSGGCGGGDSHKVIPGPTNALLSCSENPPDPVGSPSGITVGGGQVTGTMVVSCEGGGVPDSYNFRMILVHNGVMLSRPGIQPITSAPSIAQYVSIHDTCVPGVWHIYYLAVWTYHGATVTNKDDKVTTVDRVVSASDCE